VNASSNFAYDRVNQISTNIVNKISDDSVSHATVPQAPSTATAAGPPSDRARALVVGAFDLHVHIEPDLPPRRIDDVTLARRCA